MKRKYYKLEKDFCCKGCFFMKYEGLPVGGAYDIEYNGQCPKCKKHWEVAIGHSTLWVVMDSDTFEEEMNNV